MSSVLITGSNRGLGLEFCKQYAKEGWDVLACCRHPDQAVKLNNLVAYNPHVRVHEMDVMDRNGIDALANDLKDLTIDLLIANAGVYGDSRGHEFGNLDYADWIRTLETNVLGVVKVAEAFLPNLKRSRNPLIAVLSSQMGSIADNSSGGSILYRSSKAALNAAMKSLAIDLQNTDVGVLIFHPGWVKTDMGGSHALIDVETSAGGMIKQISDFKMSQTGRFIKYDGTCLPW
jgi:NAD(P)-dependent dehydrogenase (short-subunit alcohol dehydrogenase family)